jgi:hypothetical protein
MLAAVLVGPVVVLDVAGDDDPRALGAVTGQGSPRPPLPEVDAVERRGALALLPSARRNFVVSRIRKLARLAPSPAA